MMITRKLYVLQTISLHACYSFDDIYNGAEIMIDIKWNKIGRNKA